VIFVCNNEPDLLKEYLALWTHSDYVMSASAETYKNANYAGQYTVFDENWFRAVNGAWFSRIPRDMTSPGFVEQNDARLNGNRMKGYFIIINLQSPPLAMHESSLGIKLFSTVTNCFIQDPIM
jgi:hypothetical protein